VQTEYTPQQQTSQSETLHPEPPETADIQQNKDEPPSKRTRLKCPLKSSTPSQQSRHTCHSGEHLTQQLPRAAPSTTQPTHIDTQSMCKEAQQYDCPPRKMTRSQCNSTCNTCPNHMTPHQTPDTPPAQQLPPSAPVYYPNLSYDSQSSTS